ncbi:siderophore-interacting protein [Piscinibacter sp. XHJ-5]|uniref:siderophore-interacting protein n=1 Tax=Piscinibacter sp. XHJ-5 TaxID=3037797 RepID=UPI002452A1B1|nr:siderophore-interacting protein [Piscinibacter sp. XHJ-5]
MTESTTPTPRRRSPPRRITVRRIQTLSPAMRRITFGGPDLAGFGPPAPAGYLKLVFPEPGRQEAVPPAPEGPRPSSMRTYTPRRFDAGALELDVDFVLHGEGPASNWVERAELGDALYMMGPGPGYAVDRSAPLHWLIGDDSALPAIETLLEVLPETSRAEVFAEVVSADEERTLAGTVARQVHWLPRGPDKNTAGAALEAALRARPAPPLGTRIYIACEAMAMRRLRRLLIEELGVPKAQVIGRGYWKLGEVNHPDHDYGDD